MKTEAGVLVSMLINIQMIKKKRLSKIRQLQTEVYTPCTHIINNGFVSTSSIMYIFGNNCHNLISKYPSHDDYESIVTKIRIIVNN